MPDVRLAVPDDSPAIAEVIARAFEGYRGKLTPPSSSLDKTPEAVRRELETATALVAEENNTLIGCILFQAKDGAIEVSRLAVVPEYRGQGLGERLLNAVDEQAEQAGLARVRLSVRLVLHDLRAFYARRGFTVETYGTHEGFDEPTFVTLSKSL